MREVVLLPELHVTAAGVVVGSALQKHVEPEDAPGQVGVTQLHEAPLAEEVGQVAVTVTELWVLSAETHVIACGAVPEQEQWGVPVQNGVHAHVVDGVVLPAESEFETGTHL